MRIVAVLLVLLNLSAGAFADLQGIFAYGRISFKNFTDRDGLPQNSAMSMAMDSRGRLWVGTQYGAAYYDGYSWSALNMPEHRRSNYVQTIKVFSDESIWFGTLANGVCKLKDGKWTVYNKLNGALLSNQVWSILEVGKGYSSSVWIGTDNGLAILTGSKWQHLTTENSELPSNSVRTLEKTQSADGSVVIWIGTSNGLVRVDGDNWKVYTPGNSPLPSAEIAVIAPSKSGSHAVWIGTDGGLAHFQQDETWQTYTRQNTPLPYEPISTLLETTNLRGKLCLWIGTNGGGLVKFDDSGWFIFNSRNSSLPIDAVRSLLETTYGTANDRMLWVGLNGGGVVRCEYGKWVKVDKNSGILSSDNVRSIAETNEGGESTFWFSTQGGLTQYHQGKSVTYLPQEIGFTTASLTSLLVVEFGIQGRKKLLVGSWGSGLAVADCVGKKLSNWQVFNKSNSGLLDDRITCLVKAAGLIFVGTASGLMVFDGSKLKVFPNEYLAKARVESVAETIDKQRNTTLWFGLYNSGLARLVNGQLFLYHASNSALPNDTVVSLYVESSDGSSSGLWVGTYGGLAVLDPSNPGGSWRVLTDETQPSLPNNIVSQVLRDRSGRFYVCTFRGVLRLDLLNEGYSTYVFTAEDGLPGNGVNPRAAIMDRAGRLWVGTLYGVGMLDTTFELEDKTAKPLNIDQVYVNDRPVRSLGELEYHQNNVSFDYTLVSFFKGSESRYKRQLVGYEAEASDWTSVRHSTYTNLPAGDYIFKVWGKDYIGNVTGPVQVIFSIKPAPWRTWWAYTAYVLGAIGFISVFFWMRITALRQQNALLEAKVVERTSELERKTQELFRMNEELEQRVAERTKELSESERRARLSEQAALEASHAKTVFISNISHELRTPLNSILGYSRLMQKSKSLASEDLRNLESIVRSGELLLKLINEIISITRLETAKAVLDETEFELAGFLNEIVSSFSQKAALKGLELKLSINNYLPKKVYGDKDKLYQVLYSLVDNAVKFTKVGYVELKVEYLGNRFKFEVVDTGVGISAQDMKVLFEPFVQSRSGPKSADGLGLGLAIAQRYVQAMGGSLVVESELAKGSKFSFEVVLKAVDLPQQCEEIGTTDPSTSISLEEKLCSLDRLWLQQLRDTLLIGDDMAALELLKQSEGCDKQLISDLELMIRQFQFDVILDAIGRLER
ncbi:MAG: ATP-binding protein [Acidobacteriota bacterium]|nr:ATP-binding protein [Blastocatellia bacterium]MDW8413339.1 ATP-binding protein [Acidobacteriota bacterium]